jgi:hypothetical protein
MDKIARTCGVFALAATIALVAGAAGAADDLSLAPSLSFSDDSSSSFPISGKNLEHGALAGDRATIIFFGTAHCWNTNREAERLVSLYPKYRGKIDFVVVDLNRPSDEQRGLIAKYYRGFIPTIAVINKNARLLYDRAGETASERGDTSKLQDLLESAR